MSKLALTIMTDRLEVCRLEPDAPLPNNLTGLPFWSLTRTAEELSIVVPEGSAPTGCPTESGWRALKVEGPLDFSLTGILASLSGALANVGIGLFAISTYDTDYILVKEDKLRASCEALRGAGHHFT
ncbi:MAG: ACT domain-containing protein [Gemmatimonadota bacterium]|nr:ACT domain-containing protein [Gemmatimonadota bacterium]